MTLSLLAMMAPTDSPSSGLSLLLFQIGAIALVFYFLILRPQQQARKKHEALLKELKKGEEIVTMGGIIGKVKDIKDDRITIDSGGTTLVVERGRIVKVGDQAAPGGVT
ncbi:MAG TPA: preprotein translocase subunit YajC [Gemmatimonadales bacterium]|nr:preprotein translocase subunit YajC [Gemmatimonadales bacterium]